MTRLQIRVISKLPPGGRCALYTAYAEAISQYIDSVVEIEYQESLPQDGIAYPALVVNNEVLSPADGVILSPEDVCSSLAKANTNSTTTRILMKALTQIQSRLI